MMMTWWCYFCLSFFLSLTNTVSTSITGDDAVQPNASNPKAPLTCKQINKPAKFCLTFTQHSYSHQRPGQNKLQPCFVSLLWSLGEFHQGQRSCCFHYFLQGKYNWVHLMSEAAINLLPSYIHTFFLYHHYCHICCSSFKLITLHVANSLTFCGVCSESINLRAHRRASDMPTIIWQRNQ